MTEEKLIFRDKLALERTYLAKERTTLAYVRTGLALIGVALFVYRFLELDEMVRLVLVGVALVPGIYATSFGLYRTLISRRERREFVKGYRSKLK
jgi:putative membrane protein